jgi:hypothetical protein
MNATRRSARLDLTDPEPDAAAMDGTRGHALAATSSVNEHRSHDEDRSD